MKIVLGYHKEALETLWNSKTKDGHVKKQSKHFIWVTLSFIQEQSGAERDPLGRILPHWDERESQDPAKPHHCGCLQPSPPRTPTSSPMLNTGDRHSHAESLPLCLLPAAGDGAAVRPAPKGPSRYSALSLGLGHHSALSSEEPELSLLCIPSPGPKYGF